MLPIISQTPNWINGSLIYDQADRVLYQNILLLVPHDHTYTRYTIGRIHGGSYAFSLTRDTNGYSGICPILQEPYTIFNQITLRGVTDYNGYASSNNGINVTNNATRRIRYKKVELVDFSVVNWPTGAGPLSDSCSTETIDGITNEYLMHPLPDSGNFTLVRNAGNLSSYAISIKNSTGSSTPFHVPIDPIFSGLLNSVYQRMRQPEYTLNSDYSITFRVEFGPVVNSGLPDAYAHYTMTYHQTDDPQLSIVPIELSVPAGVAENIACYPNIESGETVETSFGTIDFSKCVY